jgi:hypothetical protein
VLAGTWQIDPEETMKKATKISKGLKTAAITLALMQAGNTLTWPARAAGQEKEKPVETTQTGFYCNIKALTLKERAVHMLATQKLKARHTQVIETDKGYELQFSPADVSVTEVAEWVRRESKCCPFFDFHIDLENEGKLVCLRLTGREGIKAFIRSEFELH